MRLGERMGPYLEGASFSRGLEVAFEFDAQDRVYEVRQDVLVRLCEGRRVIHAGCVDHSIELIEEKRTHGLWLHQRVVEAAAHCVGVDIAEDGIRHMRDTLGFADVVLGDIAAGSNPTLDEASWDLLLLPEVLEHIGDPVTFLGSIHRRFQGNVQELVVTVPNAFSRGNGRRAAVGREVINSDHRFWFTPYTAAKVLADAGFTVDEIRMCTNVAPEGFGPLRRRYYEKRPLIRDNIILRCRFQRS